MKIQNKEKYDPIVYGLADLGPAAVDIFLKVYLLLFFNVILGLSPTLTSLAIGLGVLWDALIDPWIGVYSDRYFHKHGHRKFIIYGATILIVITFYTLWRIPPLSEAASFILLFILSSLLNSAISLYSVPYIAIANDLEHDNEKRKKWTGWRLAFLNLGAFIGLTVPAIFLTSQTSPAHPAQPYQEASLVLCLLLVVCSVFSIYFVYKDRKFKIQEVPQENRKKLKELIADKSFLQMMASYFVTNCGIGLNSALALYYYKDFLQFTEKQTQSILILFLFVFTMSLPFWIYLTRHFNKQKLIIAGTFILGLVNAIFFPQFKNSDFYLIFFLGSFVGGTLVGVAVVLEIYLSDFLKDKEIQTKQNVSGQYLGVWKMASKISRAVAIALAGPILQYSADKQVLANYFGGVVGLFFMLGAIVMAIPIKKD